MYKNDVSVSFLSFNRNKRSLAIDLKHEDGLKAVERIIENADVLVENFRPGVMERLGLGYDRLKEINPRLIYCASCGFGQSGPYVKRPGQDLLIQAMTGMTVLTGNADDLPSATIAGIADLSTSQLIVYGVCAALYSRERMGKGQRVDTNLYNSLLSLYTQEIANYLNGGGIPERSKDGYPNPYVGARFGIFQTKHKYVAIAMNPINKLAGLLGIDKYHDVEGNSVFEREDEIMADLKVALLARTAEAWLEILLAADIWCAPVYDFSDLETDPQIAENEMIITYEYPIAGQVRAMGMPVKFQDTPGQITSPAPLLGQHTDDILCEIAGYRPEEVQDLLRKNAVFNGTSIDG